MSLGQYDNDSHTRFYHNGWIDGENGLSLREKEDDPIVVPCKTPGAVRNTYAPFTEEMTPPKKEVKHASS